MSADIGPGDFVERIDGTTMTPRGTVTRVLNMGEGGACSRCGNVDATLVLSIGPPGALGWCPNHWRPIYRPKSTLIESLNAPAPSEREPSLTPA